MGFLSLTGPSPGGEGVSHSAEQGPEVSCVWGGSHSSFGTFDCIYLYACKYIYVRIFIIYNVYLLLLW